MKMVWYTEKHIKGKKSVAKHLSQYANDVTHVSDQFQTHSVMGMSSVMKIDKYIRKNTEIMPKRCTIYPLLHAIDH